MVKQMATSGERASDARGAATLPGAREAETTGGHYEAMRGRIGDWLRRHTGPRYEVLRQVLFLVPDVFTLVFRLARDSRVSLANRLKLWGLMVYILSPIDVNIDFILPFGPLDDLALALVVLDSVLRETPDDILQDNWPGDEDAIDKLRGLTSILWAIKRPHGRGSRRDGSRRNGSRRGSRIG